MDRTVLVQDRCLGVFRSFCSRHLRFHIGLGCVPILAAMFLLAGCLVDQTVSGGVFDDANRAETLYGQGVHAFFGNDYREAADLLSEVEKLQSQDPRPYYFLALAHARLGQKDKADQYFQKAARLEWDSRSARDYNVSEALRRVQGRERLAIENYRTQARAEWLKEEKRRQEIKFGAEKEKDRQVIAQIAKPTVARAPFGASSVNPFASTAPAAPAPVAKVNAVQKTEPAKKVDDDPFAASADETEKKAADKKNDEDDPFAAPADEKKKPEAEKAQAAEDDDEDDPFK